MPVLLDDLNLDEGVFDTRAEIIQLFLQLVRFLSAFGKFFFRGNTVTQRSCAMVDDFVQTS